MPLHLSYFLVTIRCCGICSGADEMDHNVCYKRGSPIIIIDMATNGWLIARTMTIAITIITRAFYVFPTTSNDITCGAFVKFNIK